MDLATGDWENSSAEQMEAEGGPQWTEFGSKVWEAVNAGIPGERMMLFD